LINIATNNLNTLNTLNLGSKFNQNETNVKYNWECMLDKYEDEELPLQNDDEDYDNEEIKEHNVPKSTHPISDKEFRDVTKTKNDVIISKFIDVHQCLKENYFTFENKRKLSNVSVKSHNVTPHDKKFKIHQKADPKHFTNRDIIYYNKKQITMTNSIVYYLNHFYMKGQYFEFPTKYVNDKPITVILIKIDSGSE
jgi:hypothetical protein